VDEPWRFHVYASMDGTIPLRDLIAWLETEHPRAGDPLDVEVNFATLRWDEVASQAEIDEHKAWVAAREEESRPRREKWEREKLAELKAKYEPEETT